jgi:SAM-dependent methyltransferase
LEARLGSLAGLRVLDLGAAYGGDSIALRARGAECVAVDRFDHQYASLSKRLPLDARPAFMLADGLGCWPFADASFDVVISLSLVELVDDLDLFFRELLRVLRPGGVALVHTGTALRMARNDPLYHLPLISLLPTPMRRLVAERLFGRKYRFPVSRHTFYSAGLIQRYVNRAGGQAQPATYQRNRLIAQMSRWPLARLWQSMVRNLMFDFVWITPFGG